MKRFSVFFATAVFLFTLSLYGEVSLRGPSADYSTVAVGTAPDGKKALIVDYDFKVMKKSGNTLFIEPSTGFKITKDVTKIEVPVFSDACRHRIYFLLKTSNYKVVFFFKDGAGYKTIARQGWTVFSFDPAKHDSFWGGDPKVKDVKYPYTFANIWFDPINRSHLKGRIYVGEIVLHYKDGHTEKHFLGEEKAPAPGNGKKKAIILNVKPSHFAALAWDGESNFFSYSVSGLPRNVGKGFFLAEFFDPDGNLLAKEEQKITFPQGNVKGSIKVPQNIQGYYSLRCRIYVRERHLLAEKTVTGGNFTTVPQPEAEHARLGVGFWNWRCDYNAVLSTIRKMGIRYLRTDAVWTSIEKKKHVYSWDEPDRMYETALRNQLKLLITIPYVPRWAAVQPYHQYGGNPRPEAWSDFVEVLARRYRGKVSVYEAWNEPDTVYHWTGGSKTYAEHLRLTAAAVRKGDPDAKIAHAGLTGNRKDAMLFTEKMLKYPVAGTFDIFSFHYGKGSLAPEYRALLKKAKIKAVLWNTESGFGTPVSMIRNALSDFADGTDKSFHFEVQHYSDEFKETFILDKDFLPNPIMPMYRNLAKELGERSVITRERSLPGQETFRIDHPGKKGMHFAVFGKRSSGFLVKTDAGKVVCTDAYGKECEIIPENGMAGIPGSDLVWLRADGKLTLLPQEILHLESSGPVIAGGKSFFRITMTNPTAKKISCELSLDSSASWNRHTEKKQIVLSPGETQKQEMVLIPSFEDADHPFRADASLRINGKLFARNSLYGKVSHPLRVTVSPAVSGKKGIRASFENTSVKKLDFTFRMEPPASWASAFEKKFSLPPGKKENFEFLFAPAVEKKITYGKNYICHEVIAIEGHEFHRDHIFAWTAVPPMPENGKILELPPEIVTEKRKDFIPSSRILILWTGPKDFSTAFRWGWTEKALHFRWDVTDDVHASDPQNIWNGDSIQIFFNGTLYDIALLDGKVVILSHNSAEKEYLKWKVRITRKKGKTVYELEMPGKWKSGDRFQFAYCVNDNDGEKMRKGWMWGLAPVGDAMKRKESPTATLK